MGNFEYMTNRTVQNKAGEEKGRIKVLVPKGSGTAEVEYICPECCHSKKTTQQWQRPFSIKCENCGFLIRVPSMKKEIKKKKKT